MSKESTGKRITDELRKWFDRYTMRKDVYDELTAIADRIDAEHEKAMAAAALIAGVPITDENMAQHGWVRLPKDADGEYIHVGDEMDTEHFGTVEVEGFVHNSIAFYNYSGQPAYLCTSPVTLCRHHHAPTVEDVLREFADAMNENMGMYTGEVIDADEWRDADRKTIAEYAAKLRLAGGDAE